ncbi:hypothetical protein COO60DRAFT_1534331 [Scenedesmus sp. NREL 46B-D3]|nr:hypothetical protein COO60DRAFT_1534331 [Scenedesmus sp. NREL 46B-D3]
MLAPLMTCRKQLSRSSIVCCCATAVHDSEDSSGAREQDLHSQTWRRKLQRCMCLLLWVLTKRRIRTATSHGVVSCCRSWSRTTPRGVGAAAVLAILQVAMPLPNIVKTITEQYLATNTGSCSAVFLCLHTDIVMPTSSMVTIAGFGNPLCHLHTMHWNKGTML